MSRGRARPFARRPRWVPAGSRRDLLRWWAGRHRRALAAALTALSVWAGLTAVRAPARAAPATVAVLVAAHDLAPGTVLVAADLRTMRFPPADVPPSALRAGVLGRALAVAVPAGVPLTAGSLAVGRVLPAGTVATPVRLADPGEAALVVPGDRVDVLAAPGSATDAGAGLPAAGAGSPAADAGAGLPAAGAGSPAADAGVGPSAADAAPVVVAADTVVLAVPAPDTDDGDQGGLLVLATTPAAAAVLARDAGTDRLSVTLRAS